MSPTAWPTKLSRVCSSMVVMASSSSRDASFQVADRRFERPIHVKQRFECDVHHVAVRLVVEHLVAAKGLGVLDFEERIAAPAGAIRLVVRHATVDVTPVPRPGERLEGFAPCLIEFRLADALGIDETL